MLGAFSISCIVWVLLFPLSHCFSNHAYMVNMLESAFYYILTQPEIDDDNISGSVRDKSNVAFKELNCR